MTYQEFKGVYESFDYDDEEDFGKWRELADYEPEHYRRYDEERWQIQLAQYELNNFKKVLEALSKTKNSNQELKSKYEKLAKDKEVELEELKLAFRKDTK